MRPLVTEGAIICLNGRRTNEECQHNCSFSFYVNKMGLRVKLNDDNAAIVKRMVDIGLAADEDDAVNAFFGYLYTHHGLQPNSALVKPKLGLYVRP